MTNYMYNVSFYLNYFPSKFQSIVNVNLGLFNSRTCTLYMYTIHVHVLYTCTCTVLSFYQKYMYIQLYMYTYVYKKQFILHFILFFSEVYQYLVDLVSEVLRVRYWPLDMPEKGKYLILVSIKSSKCDPYYNWGWNRYCFSIQIFMVEYFSVTNTNS